MFILDVFTVIDQPAALLQPSSKPMPQAPRSLSELLAPLVPVLKQVQQRLVAANPAEAQPLAEALLYSLEGAGKMVRPALTALVFHAVTGKQETPEALLEVATVSELIHIATLMHDDVLDDSPLRRGRPTTKQRFGNTLAILGGDWLLAQASLRLAKLGHLELVAWYAQVLADLCDGEVEQWRSSFELEQAQWSIYFAKSQGKTASLFATACKAAAFVAEAPATVQEACYTYGLKFGLCFQLVDDVLDYAASSEVLGKPVLADLKQGLVNAPLLLALEADSLSQQEKQELKRCIEQWFAWQQTHQQPLGTSNLLSVEERALQERVLALLNKANAVEAAYKLAETLAEEAKTALACLPNNAARQQLILLVEATVRRAS
jgi:all-trans-nonaprenyl-diphosphate synthase